jgi:hypothetical protein
MGLAEEDVEEFLAEDEEAGGERTAEEFDYITAS